MSIQELVAAKDYLERAHCILKSAGSVLADEVNDNIQQVRGQIDDLKAVYVG